MYNALSLSYTLIHQSCPEQVAAFVSGGILPQAVRGKVAEGLAGIYDWSATFYALAGVATPRSGIDGMNLWPWLSGAVETSPRKEVVLMLGGRGAIRDEQYKIVVGRCCPEGYPGLCQRGGPRSPNASTMMNTTDTDCTEGPCVFDLKVMNSFYRLDLFVSLDVGTESSLVLNA